MWGFANMGVPDGSQTPKPQLMTPGAQDEQKTERPTGYTPEEMMRRLGYTEVTEDGGQ